MTRLLLIGTGPLLEDPATRLVSGQCLRTVHFARPLREAGHDLKILTIPIPGTVPDQSGRTASRKATTADGLSYRQFLTTDPVRISRAIRRLLASESFDAVVAVNQYPAFCTALANPALPFWSDLNGWTIAEGQARAARENTDEHQDHFLKLETVPLLAADRFSTVSTRQAHALYGELGLTGRLNAATFHYPFTSTIPNAVHAAFESLVRGGTIPAHPSLPNIPKDAHLVLWSGGFNAWMDIKALVEGLRKALKACPEMHFVATGGPVTGHDETSWESFRAMAATRLPAGRVHLAGWVETPLMLALHACADVGINVDAPNTETLFGARNRLTNMLGAGVPVLTTAGTEIADWIRANGAGEVVDSGNAGALAAALIDSAANRDRWIRRARKARRLALRDFAPSATLRDFLVWCSEPSRAPDVSTRGSSEALAWARVLADGTAREVLEGNASYHALRRKIPLKAWYKLKALAGQ